MDLAEQPPPLATMKKMARQNGKAVKTSRSGLFWLVREPTSPTDPGKLLSPRRGVGPEELWILLTAPTGHRLLDIVRASPGKVDEVVAAQAAEDARELLAGYEDADELRPDADGKVSLDDVTNPLP